MVGFIRAQLEDYNQTTRTATRPKEKEEVGFSTGTKHYKTKHCTFKGKEAEKKLFKDLDQSL